MHSQNSSDSTSFYTHLFLHVFRHITQKRNNRCCALDIFRRDYPTSVSLLATKKPRESLTVTDSRYFIQCLKVSSVELHNQIMISRFFFPCRLLLMCSKLLSSKLLQVIVGIKHQDFGLSDEQPACIQQTPKCCYRLRNLL